MCFSPNTGYREVSPPLSPSALRCDRSHLGALGCPCCRDCGHLLASPPHTASQTQPDPALRSPASLPTAGSGATAAFPAPWPSPEPGCARAGWGRAEPCLTSSQGHHQAQGPQQHLETGSLHVPVVGRRKGRQAGIPGCISHSRLLIASSGATQALPLIRDCESPSETELQLLFTCPRVTPGGGGNRERAGNSGGCGAGWLLEFPRCTHTSFSRRTHSSPDCLAHYSGRDLQWSAAPSSSPTKASLSLGW